MRPLPGRHLKCLIVKYEEIVEFFIAWLRKNPPPEFADWVWDSRRSLAIKGSDEDFRRGMVAAYLAKKLDTLRPDEASAARVLRELVKNQRLG